MKNFIVAAFALATIASCSTDFNVIAEWEDITVVYGLLDPTDTAQYIKIGKAYLDPKTSALIIAQIPDSLYYQNLDVKLEQYTNGNFITSFPLVKVDGNLEGYPKEDGIFSKSPNWLYKTSASLDEESSYRLVIIQSDDGKTVSGSTEIINDFTVLRPTPQQKVNFFPGSNYIPQWFTAEDGKIYGLIIRFHYTESLIADPSQTESKFVDWEIFSSIRVDDTAGGDEISYDIPGEAFYNVMNSLIEDNPAVFREAGKLDFLFSVGAEALDTYNQVAQAQQGLTSGQVLPEYTNIENGIGLFSSRYHKNVIDVPLDPKTIDTLACSEGTKHLNFKNSLGFFCQ